MCTKLGKKFRYFLIRQGAWGNYLEALGKRNEYPMAAYGVDSEDVMEVFGEVVTHNRNNPNNLVNGSFIWRGTKQGRDYWVHIQRIWREELAQNDFRSS